MPEKPFYRPLLVFTAQPRKSTFREEMVTGKTLQQECSTEKSHTGGGFCWGLFSGRECDLFVELCCKPVLSPTCLPTPPPQKSARFIQSSEGKQMDYSGISHLEVPELPVSSSQAAAPPSTHAAHCLTHTNCIFL